MYRLEEKRVRREDERARREEKRRRADKEGIRKKLYERRRLDKKHRKRKLEERCGANQNRDRMFLSLIAKIASQIRPHEPTVEAQSSSLQFDQKMVVVSIVRAEVVPSIEQTAVDRAANCILRNFKLDDFDK